MLYIRLLRFVRSTQSSCSSAARQKVSLLASFFLISTLINILGTISLSQLYDTVTVLGPCMNKLRTDVVLLVPIVRNLLLENFLIDQKHLGSFKFIKDAGCTIR